MKANSQTLVPGELRERIGKARRVFVLTGAGVSAESGVPTFRGGGDSVVWKGMPFDVVSSARMVESDPALVWEWFDYRRRALTDITPNPAHAALARWQDNFEAFTLATQNVDGLHAAAGSRDVLELHGNVWRARCVRCEARRDLREIDKDEDAARPPVCARCGGALRPDVTLFGELLPEDVFERAASEASKCEVCVVVGTSALVYPAARLPEIALRSGAYLIEVNPEPTPLSTLCHVTIEGAAGVVLPLFGI